jgi:hypothetical protein
VAAAGIKHWGDESQVGKVNRQRKEHGLFVLALILLLVTGCQFQPDIVPLNIPTAPPQPFSAFAPTEMRIDQMPSSQVPAQSLGDIEESRGSSPLLATLARAAGLIAIPGLGLAGLSMLVRGQADRPPIWLLVFLGILFLVLFGILLEALFAAAEAILALAAPTLITALLSLTVAAIGMFLVNFEVAFAVYVYRVVAAPERVEVKLDLTPFDWGLRP